MPRYRPLLMGSLIAALAAGTASADTLREALASTYRTNPTLMAQREVLKGADAGVALARAGGLPRISAIAGINRDLTRSGILAVGSKGTDLTVGADISYPLFQGGRVKNSVRAAKTRVEAGRSLLEAVEGDVFTDAVAAYMDVIRDRAIVELNQNNVRVLQTNLEATRDRFEIGDLTRTDIAQSEARLELARSNLALADARLALSFENYKRVIGHPPDDLAPPPPLPPLPATAEEAVRIALVTNPDLTAMTRQAEAAGFDVRVARASRLPTLTAGASSTYFNAIEGAELGLPNSGTESTVGLNATIPIYQGGEPAARIRQAQAFEGQLMEQVIESERLVVATTRTAHAAYEATVRAIQSSELAVKANELALEGTRAEQSVGTRNVLDVLNAEQELLNSQVTLVTARRDQYVAGFQLLNAMGQTQAEDLGLDGGPLYDPLGNYRRVAGNWNDWASDPRHVPVSTRTVTPAEEPQMLPAPHDQ
ncbi:MAG TPA: TolC family outer membrane protein [Sphingomicrobium sp.]|nr:TolC family outer membrane protein [Sphingomicrobium sp.]